eukprot:3254367-Rhodomonas_salina.2
MRCPVLTRHMMLVARYAMPGTDEGYGARTSRGGSRAGQPPYCAARQESTLAGKRRWVYHCATQHMVLGACYAIPGTDIACAARWVR